MRCAITAYSPHERADWPWLIGNAGTQQTSPSLHASFKTGCLRIGGKRIGPVRPDLWVMAG